MEQQGGHGNQVHRHDAHLLKALHDHGENIGSAGGIKVPDSGDGGIGYLEGELQEVIDEERKDQSAGPDHVPACEGRAQMVRDCVGLRF